MALLVRAKTVGIVYRVRRHLFNRSALYIFTCLCFYHISELRDGETHTKATPQSIFLLQKKIVYSANIEDHPNVIFHNLQIVNVGD